MGVDARDVRVTPSSKWLRPYAPEFPPLSRAPALPPDENASGAGRQGSNSYANQLRCLPNSSARQLQISFVPIRLALFEPDIPQNAGTIVRMAACLGVAVDLIEPAGFLLGDRQYRRAGLDYLAIATLRRFPSWRAYQADREPGRLLLLTTRGDEPYVSFRFRADDVLLLGRESAGVPDAVHAAADARLGVPMLPGARSLNVAVAAAMVLGEALRQTGGFAAGI
jgi:tRNA (cytidine/uridine-2'-O-)-methyltransferase